MQLELFVADRMRCDAACFCIAIIGEAFRSVPSTLRERVTAIPWRAIVGMRDRLVHKYWDIDFETVFRVATEHAQPLVDGIDGLFQELP